MTTRRDVEHGFTVIELLISMSIMIGLTGALFAIVNPGQGIFRVQPEAADIQQRLRVSARALSRDLMMAGAGTYLGSAVGPMVQFFPPVRPYRIGKRHSDAEAGLFFRSDAITVFYVPATAAQTAIDDVVSSLTSRVRLAHQAGCPTGDALCGFRKGQTVLVFDDSGSADSFRITETRDNMVELARQGQFLSKTYGVGSYISQVETHTYYLDGDRDQLMHYDGWETEVPVVDNIVELRFRYFAAPDAPRSPKPPPGLTNCLFDATGNSRLKSLGPTDGPLVELDASGLQDGPWCGDANRFDADLYRLKTIRVEIRAQAAMPSLRGRDPKLFRRPGSAVGGTSILRDYEVRFDISPRNMSLGR